jgi:hypothetical protein
MHEAQLQDYLFQRIKEKLSATASLADAVAETLFISNDSAYRRIRGETPLVLEEARTLCARFSISFDEVLHSKSNTVSFLYSKINNQDYSFEKYLQGILSNLKMVAASEKKEIIYLTKDIPVFYNFLFQPLFSFRYFFWMKSILQHPGFVHNKFSSTPLPKEIEDMGREIAMAYNNIPSIEIWNAECINSTIAQIEYYREAGYFESEDDVKKIYDSLAQLIEHIRAQAEAGCKFLPGENSSARQDNFQFFYNRVVLGDNTIMITINDKKILYLTYDVLNYMTTQDEKFCNDIHENLQLLIRRATMLSGAGDKQRNIFFNLLLKKVPQSHHLNLYK